MLFPWAKCNLKDYWRNTEPKNTPEFVQWIATQCRGIAQGLQKIHRKPSNHAQDFGIHGDIKPENLLLFESPRYPEGILVISDFGFTRFHCRDTRSNTSFIGWSPTHCAPEVQLGKKISRSYDIWTLGCVYVEFATWYLTGSKGVGDEFVRRRLQDDQVGPSGIRYDKFFNVHLTSEGRQKPELKDSVQKVSTVNPLSSLGLCAWLTVESGSTS